MCAMKSAEKYAKVVEILTSFSITYSATAIADISPYTNATGRPPHSFKNLITYRDN